MIKVYYIDPDSEHPVEFPCEDYEFIKHADEVYTLEEFQEAWDDQLISDMGYIRIIDDEKFKKGYIVVCENIHENYDEPEFYAGETVYTNLKHALKDLNEQVEEAKTDEDGFPGWLQDMLAEHPEQIVEEWVSDRHVIFYEKNSGNKLEFYINEVTIK